MSRIPEPDFVWSELATKRPSSDALERYLSLLMKTQREHRELVASCRTKQDTILAVDHVTTEEFELVRAMKREVFTEEEMQDLNSRISAARSAFNDACHAEFADAGIHANCKLEEHESSKPDTRKRQRTSEERLEAFRWIAEHAILQMDASWYDDGQELNVYAADLRKMFDAI